MDQMKKIIICISIINKQLVFKTNITSGYSASLSAGKHIYLTLTKPMLIIVIAPITLVIMLNKEIKNCHFSPFFTSTSNSILTSSPISWNGAQ